MSFRFDGPLRINILGLAAVAATVMTTNILFLKDSFVNQILRGPVGHFRP
jgi:hypothetical protein